MLSRDLGKYVDLPDERDQLGTRSLPRFAELRARVYARIQEAKRGAVPSAPGQEPSGQPA